MSTKSSLRKVIKSGRKPISKRNKSHTFDWAVTRVTRSKCNASGHYFCKTVDPEIIDLLTEFPELISMEMSPLSEIEEAEFNEIFPGFPHLDPKYW